MQLTKKRSSPKSLWERELKLNVPPTILALLAIDFILLIAAPLLIGLGGLSPVLLIPLLIPFGIGIFCIATKKVMLGLVLLLYSLILPFIDVIYLFILFASAFRGG